jgi:hypothetical protein
MKRAAKEYARNKEQKQKYERIDQRNKEKF